MQKPPFSCIILLGTTSSGKSTLSEKIAKKLELQLIELDAFHWVENWKPVPDSQFLSHVEQAINSERWVVAGSYHIARDVIWAKADLAIWLDYSFVRIFWQLTKRIFKRWWTQELLWGTNRENLWVHFKLWSTDSLYHWLFKTYWKRKKEYPNLLSSPTFCHIKVLRFKSPKETEVWLKMVDK